MFTIGSRKIKNRITFSLRYQILKKKEMNLSLPMIVFFLFNHILVLDKVPSTKIWLKRRRTYLGRRIMYLPRSSSSFVLYPFFLLIWCMRHSDSWCGWKGIFACRAPTFKMKGGQWRRSEVHKPQYVVPTCTYYNYEHIII